MSLKNRITDDMKTAMREKATDRLATIRLLTAAMKQREVDERIELTDTDIVAIIEKMLKQRRDSIQQFEAAARHDLADKEKAEMVVLSAYMPEQLTEDEILAHIDAAIASTGASGPQGMGKLMAELKPKLTGRTDMSKVSGLIKSRLSA